MSKCKFLIFISVILAAAALSWGISPEWAQAAPVTGPGSIPDYFQTPNWANSPPLNKFVDTLPVLGSGANKIPVAIANSPYKAASTDPDPYPGSDYYEIGLVEYTQQMHGDLPATGTRLRGYVQLVPGTWAGGTDLLGNSYTAFPLTNPDGTPLVRNGVTYYATARPTYLGPVVVATKDKPVRVKFTNLLPLGADGKLFVPVDVTIEGAGTGPDGTFYTQNRGTLHLHGGRTPWISDGTPHQWTVPAGEVTNFKKGVSSEDVPDMPPTGDGEMTFYYTNQQSARLMFYHDHAWGITRLNVYVGEAAGYLLTDAMESALLGLPGGTPGVTPVLGNLSVSYGTPLVIQDKTFVNASIGDPLRYTRATDPTWNWGTGPRNTSGNITGAVTGDLWWPHVYMPAQNPYTMDGINAMGRWHYGPWFWPPTPVCGSSPQAVKPWCIDKGPVVNPYYDATCDPTGSGLISCQPPEIPGTPNVSWGAEAFLDTMLVNGKAYPTHNVPAGPVRFRILNASHDRFLNLQFYQAVSKIGYTNPTLAPYTFTGAATDLTEVAMVPAVMRPFCTAMITTNCICDPAAVPPATPAGCFPDGWPIDGREGGAPDPATRGPAFIQIGTEGGFLPAPVLLHNQPVTWNVDPTMFNVGNVLQQNQGGGTLFLGPAERADVIVDFTNFAGKTLILYNDAPTAFPALDPHYDYYTGAPDRTDIGGATAVLPGVGPNTRTVMQIVVGGTGGTAPVDDYNLATLTALQNAFKSTATTQGVFAASQEPIIVGQQAYGSIGPVDGNYSSAYYTTGINCGTPTSCFPATYPYWGVSRIGDTSIKYDTVLKSPTGVITFQRIGDNEPATPMRPKAIHDEMGGTFDNYGRMSAKLGLEVPGAFAGIANFALQNYVDPSTEILNENEVQIWKITHNGVDAHPIHFHLFDVQLINRVGWDGFIRLPDDNELGWKDTVRMHPLEDTIVAFRPIAPKQPFGIPNSTRPLNPAAPLGSTEGFSQIDPLTGGALATPTTNVMADFGWEYVWHCHILSHEENDMMRAVRFNVASVVPAAPTALNGTPAAGRINLTWTDATPATVPIISNPNLGNPANEIGFTIQRATNIAFIGPSLVTFTALANATGFADTQVVAGTQYRYRVRAFNVAGNSGWSNMATVTAGVNPVPVASSLNPNTRVAGTGAFTLTVNGSNFIPNSVVRWNGANRTTTYVSANQLTAAITAADVAAAGTASVTVFNPTPGGGPSGALTFTITNPVPATTSINPTSRAAGTAGTFTLAVNGTNFVTTSVVLWNGANRTTTYVSANQLTAAITAADVAAAGTASVTVFNPAPGGGTSNAQTFTITASNPVPTTTSISPSTAVVGSPAFTLTVNGSNFINGSVVRWNGTTTAANRPTTYVSPTQLTAAIPASDLIAAGTRQVTVFNPTPGGGTSNSQTFTITALLPPAAPTNLTGAAVRIPNNVTQDRVTLNWTDNANNETGFQIQRSLTSGFGAPTTYTVGANVTTFAQNVSRAFNYYYRVRATNASGNSGWSNVLYVTTP